MFPTWRALRAWQLATASEFIGVIVVMVGAAPLLFALAAAVQVLWAPLALLVAALQALRGRRTRWWLAMWMPLVCLGRVYSLDE
jgi:hypothetical protein